MDTHVVKKQLKASKNGKKIIFYSGDTVDARDWTNLIALEKARYVVPLNPEPSVPKVKDIKKKSSKKKDKKSKFSNSSKEEDDK